MINYYNITCTTYRNGEKLSRRYTQSLISEDNVPRTINITWENLQDVYLKYSWCLPFGLWNFKKKGE